MLSLELLAPRRSSDGNAEWNARASMGLKTRVSVPLFSLAGIKNKASCSERNLRIGSAQA